MIAFTHHTTESAPEGSRRRMTGIEHAFGYLPAAVGLMASSPEALEAFSAANAAFERSTLDPVSREVVVLAIAVRFDCHVCIAMHSARLDRLEAPAGLVAALRSGTPLDDQRYDALRAFTLACLDGRGVVDEATQAAFRRAGYDAQNALEIVLALGVYTISAFANRMTGAPLDEPLAAYA